MIDNTDILLDLLLFSVCGVHFGVDAEQVTGIEVYDGDQADDLYWFHEELDYGAGATTYITPMVVSIRTGGVKPYRVIIDSMEDIAEFSVSDIQLFPALLSNFALKRGLWGILPLQGRMILLVDFMLLLKERRADTTAMEPEQIVSCNDVPT